jgi:hypothetical protein
MSHPTRKIIFIIAGTLLVLGSATHIFDMKASFGIFVAGALPVIALQLLSLYEHKDAHFALRRLHFIAFTSTLFLAAAAFFMFTGSDLWIAGILIYALISLYVSFRS